MSLLEIIEKFWPLLIGFGSAGGSWFWANKKTKTGARLENLENESRELSNLKVIVDMVQTDLQNELRNKTQTIEELSNVIIELNKKIETLSKQIRNLNSRINLNSDYFNNIERLAKSCTIKNDGNECLVLGHLKKDKLIIN